MANNEQRKAAAEERLRASLLPYFGNHDNELDEVIQGALEPNDLENVDLRMNKSHMKEFLDIIIENIFENPNQRPQISEEQYEQPLQHFLEYVRASRGIAPGEFNNNNNAEMDGGRRRRKAKKTRKVKKTRKAKKTRKVKKTRKA